jgi:type-1 restriction enzyme ecoAI specificity protein
MIADRLRAAILQAAISGKLTDQRPEDGTATELLEQIAAERAALVKAGKLKKRKPLPLVTEDEKQLSLPANWMWSRLGDVALPNPRVNGSDTEQIGFLPMASIEDGYTGRIHPQGRKWSEVKSGFTKFAEGDVVMAKITPCFQNRKSAIVRRLGSQYGAGTTELHVLRPASLMEAEYLLFFLKTEYVQDELTPQMTGTAGQKRVPLGALTNLPIPVPPLAEQGRIVAKLHGVLPLIDQLAELEREREYLDREFAKAIERAILQAAISGKLTKQHPEDGTAKELLESIKTERQQLEKEGKIKKQKPLPPVDKTDEPFELPDTWKWAPIGSIVDLINGRAFKRHELQTSGKWPVLRVGNLFTNETWYYSDLDLEDDKYCSNGDLLYAWSASFGPHIWRGEKSIFHYHIWKVRHYSMNRDYLNYVLQWDVERIRTATTGSTMVHVSMTNMRPRTIPVAPIEEQDRIVKRLDSLLPLMDQIGKLVL